MHLRKLLLQLLAHLGRKYSRKHGTSFLQLPLNVLNLTIDELPLHSKVLLLQTCRMMRSLLRSNCVSKIHGLSSVTRLEYLAGLANVLEHHLLCAICSKLHTVDTSDVPFRPKYRPNYPCIRLWTSDSHDFGVEYSVAHRHVHLALKYSRLENIYQKYLAELLTPNHITCFSDRMLAVEFSAYPKIFDRRFFLFSRWEFKEYDTKVSMATLPFLRFCPHLQFMKETFQLLPRNPLAISIQSAFESEGSGLHNSCQRCPTDYSVHAYPDGMVFQIWQDLGSGSSPLDPYWRIHIWDDDNTEFYSPSISHSPGSIRDAYNSGDEFHECPKIDSHC